MGEEDGRGVRERGGGGEGEKGVRCSFVEML